MVKRNFINILNLLIQYGVNVDVDDYCKRTPLHIAVMFNNSDCIKKLLLEFANPTKKTQENKTAKELANEEQIYIMISRVECLYNLYSGNSIKLLFERLEKALFYIFRDFDYMMKLKNMD